MLFALDRGPIFAVVNHVNLDDQVPAPILGDNVGVRVAFQNLLAARTLWRNFRLRLCDSAQSLYRVEFDARIFLVFEHGAAFMDQIWDADWRSAFVPFADLARVRFREGPHPTSRIADEAFLCTFAADSAFSGSRPRRPTRKTLLKSPSSRGEAE